MAISDPIDARLVAALAELGTVTIHELAAQVGIDPREAAYRLVALSGSGLPLLVGVESDPQGLRAALRNLPARFPASGPQPQVPNYSPAPQAPASSQVFFSGRKPASASQPVAQSETHADSSLTTWGPPQTSAWVRRENPTSAPATQSASPVIRPGRVGDTLTTVGLEGEQLSIHLIEVQDPADFLFGAAGYRLEEGERSVVVHTEITNHGPAAFSSLPDNYLVLLSADGRPIGKAPIALTSRAPHRIGIQSGQTVGGHTVYVLPESTQITAIRWSPRPEPDHRSRQWNID